ncbi:MAG: hypothetical protein QM692_10845 [Thermomicrobiales bacterium]
MDSLRFDHVARSLARRQSRRSLGALGLGMLGVSVLPAADALGKKKKRKKKKKSGSQPNCPAGTKRCGSRCVPNEGCCADSDCDRCKLEVCQSNICSCKPGQVRGNANVCGVPLSGCQPVGALTTSIPLCCSNSGFPSGDSQYPIVCVPGQATCTDDSGCLSGPCMGFMCPELYNPAAGAGCQIAF